MGVKIRLTSTNSPGPSGIVGNDWWNGNYPSNNYVKYVVAGSTLTFDYTVTDYSDQVVAGATVNLSLVKDAGGGNFTGQLSATTDANGVATFNLVNTNTDSNSESFREDLTVWAVSFGTEYKVDITPSVTNEIADIYDLLWTHIVRSEGPTFSFNDINYVKYYDKISLLLGAKVKSNPNASGDITIPSQVTDNSIPVLGIYDEAFISNTSLTGIVLPSTLTSIGAMAFKDSGLTTIVIPSNVTTIGNNAFTGCDNLSVTFQHTNQTRLPSIETGFTGNAVANYNSGIDPPIGEQGTSSAYLKSKGFRYARMIVAPTSFSIPIQSMGNRSITIPTPTSVSPGSFTYTSSNTSVASVSGNTIRFFSQGTTTITATQLATDEYTAGTISTLLTVTDPGPMCFKEGSKILCLIDNKETYTPIENINKGTLVKTYMSGYKAVDMIGHSKIYNPANDLRSKNRLFKCSKENYPEITEDLVITGCHSILTTQLTEGQRANTIEMLGCIKVTDNHYRLMACLDDKSVPYEKEGIFNIWHLALEHDDYYMNYGIYANGLLVETTSKRMIKEFSGMELI
ncbi:MAG: hypothetical protein EBZ58_11600 [Bacteroidetes bacterium]|nr:hypothetical protein [Bacteroidota bacterium]